MGGEEEEPVLGLGPRLVRLAEPTPRWPALFAAEAERLAVALRAFGPPRIEHCGSTAVPGLAAKPILDIAIGVPASAIDVPGLAAALVPLGYAHAPRAVPEPGHEVFGKGDPRTHLLHVVTLHGEPWRRLLGFRDALRADPALAAEYAALKRELAARFPGERSSYTAGKGAFIERVVG